MAIIESVAQRRQVVEVSPAAQSRGVRRGMSAAEARAMCMNLVCVEHDLAGDCRALEALGRWLVRFTPVVARGWDDGDESLAVLFLDLTGCERLFGGIHPLVESIQASLDRFDIPVKMAVAPTVGAAWALAVTSEDKKLRIVDAPSLQDAVASLPVAALRLDEQIVDDLHHLGLHRIGDLLPLPREALPARFGALLLKRLDQLTGARPETLTKLVYDPPISARAAFDAPIESPENIQRVFEKLLGLVLADLTRRNHGVRQLRLTLTPDRGWGRPTIVRTIALSRPHRHRATLLDLIRCETERIDCEHGFARFELCVPLHEPVADTQTDLFAQQALEDQMELDRLLQRLCARLGETAVIRPELVESYLPERAWRPAQEEPAMLTASLPPRPLTLFPTPIEIRVVCEPSDDRSGHPRQFTWRQNVYRLAHVTGPERIAGEWWRGHHRTRDYYDVEDEAGRQFWIFRVLQAQGDAVVARWFLHGRFD